MSAPRKPVLFVSFVALAAIVCAMVLGAVLWRDHARQALRAGVLAAAPQGTWLLLTVDVAAGAPLLQPMLGVDGGLARVSRVAGLGSVSDACGFEPLAHIAEAMLVVPEGGEHGEFGAALSGDLTKEQLMACADKAIRARGGEPVTSSRGHYTVVVDASAPNLGSLAFREGGPTLVGRGAWLDAMIDAADGTGPRLDAAHQALRDALTAAASSSAPAVLVTALLPRSLRDRVGGELDGGSNALFAGVLSVDTASVALSVGTTSTELLLSLHCEAVAACDQVKALFERERFSLSRNLGARLLGVGPLLDALRVDARADAVTVQTKAPTGDVAQLVQRFVERGPPSRAHTPPVSPAAPVAPVPAGAPFSGGFVDGGAGGGN